MSKQIYYIIGFMLAGSLTGVEGWAQSNGTIVRSTDKAAQKANMSRSANQNKPDVLEAIANNPDFSTFLAALKQADATALLSGVGPYTIFAPTNAAFEALPAGTLDNLMREQNKRTLASVVRFHVVPGRLMLRDLEDGQQLKTIHGKELSVTKLNGKVAVNGVEISQPDLEVSNGVIHVVGQVLLPPDQGMVGNPDKK